MTAVVLVALGAVLAPCWWFIVLAELDRRGVFRCEDEEDCAR